MLRFDQPEAFSPTIPRTCVRFATFADNKRDECPPAAKGRSNGAQLRCIGLADEYPVSLSFATEWLVILIKSVTIDSPTKFITFNSFLQLRRHNFCLSLAIDFFSNHSHPISEACDFTLTPEILPCIRNTFQICPRTEQSTKKPRLKYNQDFLLQCLGWTEEPLYLCSPPRISVDDKTPDIQLRKMEGKSQNYHRWKFVHPDPEERLEMEGENIPYNSPVLLVHSASNRVATNRGVFARTIFGKEEKVSLVYHNLNAKKCNAKEDTWIIPSF
ncbi:cilia- and flagella-associated protein 161-like [Phlebotomus argentipes]|uniref:cilia- and flagella-associated protein 161-like n=1 Tax=Phlebotomus argentipes TaxID=94469 RepID=UPI002892FBA3|nr:cilia- and flagella-associated protein 161-like [Phlebotomus argentipes]